MNTRLNELLASLAPEMDAERYVFVRIKEGRYGEDASLNPIASFTEREGLTLVVRQEDADRADISYPSVFRKITLCVSSNLLDVGLTAAVATELAQRNIAANVIAAYHHDHLFVPVDRAEEAFGALRELMESR